MTTTGTTLYYVAGDDVSFTVTITDADGDAINLAGATIRAGVARYPAIDGGLIAVGTETSPPSATATVTTAASGIATVTIAAADTAELRGLYMYEVEAEDAGGNLATPVRGLIEFATPVVA